MENQKEKKFKLKSMFMVGNSDDVFGSSVVTDASLFGELTVEKNQILAFNGVKCFGTKLEAMEFIRDCDCRDFQGSIIGSLFTIVEIFVPEEVA